MNNEKADVGELINDLIMLCNTGARNLVTGNYVGWCQNNVQMVQKLTVLREQYEADMEDKNRKIESLKANYEKDGAE